MIDLVSEHCLSRDHPLLVGLAGGVAVGKSTFAAAIATELLDRGLRTDIVSTDGFLMANSRLAQLGISDRKGFPESYDTVEIHRFLDDMRAGLPSSVPVYDHQFYDVTDDAREVSDVDVVIFEGVNALHFGDRVDIGIYLDADEDAMFGWFIDRALQFREAARTTYSPFFTPWTEVTEEQFVMMARTVWADVNLPNLSGYIRPTRESADVVVEKAGDHSIRSIEIRGAT